MIVTRFAPSTLTLSLTEAMLLKRSDSEAMCEAFNDYGWPAVRQLTTRLRQRPARDPLRAGPFGVTQTEPGSTGVPERGCDDGPSSLSPAASPGGAGFGKSGESGDGGWFAPELPR